MEPFHRLVNALVPHRLTQTLRQRLLLFRISTAGRHRTRSRVPLKIMALNGTSTTIPATIPTSLDR
jgi:hypothetical protein